MNGIKYVFMDVDNTLLDFDACADEAMHDAASELSLEVPENLFDVFTLINNGLWKQMEKGEIKVQDIYENRWNIIFARIGIRYDGVKFEGFFKKNLNNTCVPENGSRELLDYLSGKYTLFAATNGAYSQQVRRLEGAGLMGYFKGVFASEKMGFSKPKKEFFEGCFSGAGKDVLPENTVMIGDSMTADVLGAKALGINTIWYNKYGFPGGEGRADFTAGRLTDIKKIL